MRTAIRECQAELGLILAEIWPDEDQDDKPRPALPAEPLDLDDGELLARARGSVNGGVFAQLHDAGDWKGAGYASQSEADLALCSMYAFWAGCDKERMDRLFRRSGLYRKKWDRAGYRNRTLDKAIAECREVYKPPKPKAESLDDGPPPIEREPGHLTQPPAQSTNGSFAHHKDNRLKLPPMPGVITAAALQKKQFRDPEFIVEGIIPQGTSLFTGKAKVGKSFAMADIALACACGGKAFGKVTVKQIGVLYLCLEDHERRVQNRIGGLCIGENWPENLHICTSWPRIDQGGIPLLQKWLEEHRDVKLVIADTLAKLKSRKPTNQTLYDVDYQSVEGLKGLADTGDVAIIIVHHLRKMAADDDPFDCISGSTGLTGAVDTALILKRDRTGKGLLYVRGRDVEEQEFALDRDSSGGWTLLGDAGAIIVSEEQNLVIEAMEDGEPTSINHIAQITGKSRQNVYRILSRLAQNGSVKRAGKGKYLKICF